MRVVLYMTTVLEQLGGFEKSFIEIATGLNEYTDLEVVIVTLDKKFTARINSLLSVYFTKNLTKLTNGRETSKAIFDMLQDVEYKQVKSFRELRDELSKYDIIYSKNELIEAFILKYIVRYSNIPPVVFLCGTALYYPVAKSITSRLHNFLYLGAIYKHLTIQVFGFHTKNAYDLELINKMFPNKPKAMIPNPFNFNEMKLRKDKSKLSLNSYSDKKLNILWAARITEQKGLNQLITIIRETNKTHLQKINWWIAGDGEDSTNLSASVKEFNNVHILGHVKSQDMPKLYSFMNLFIMTSAWESFGNTIIEAAYFNVPSISYDIPGPNSIIKNNINGYLVKDTSAFIEQIKNFSNKNVNFGNISTEIVREYGIKPISKQLADLLKLWVKISRGEAKS